MRKIYIVAALGLAACTPDTTTRTVITAAPVVAAIGNPALDAGDKTCAVLDWGIPLAESKAAAWTPRQQQALAVAKQVAAAGCNIGDAAWKQRAIAAGVELSQALWGLIR